MTRVGKGLHLIRGTPRIPECKRQIKCILSNMKRAGVKQYDIMPWNICFDRRTKTLALIDFGRASVGRMKSGAPRGKKRKKPYFSRACKEIRASLKRRTWTRQMHRCAIRQRRTKRG